MSKTESILSLSFQKSTKVRVDFIPKICEILTKKLLANISSPISDRQFI